MFSHETILGRHQYHLHACIESFTVLKEEALKRLINANVNDVQVDFISLFVDLVSGSTFDKLIVCLS